MPGSGLKEKEFHEALFSGKLDVEGMDQVLSLYRDLYPERIAGGVPGAALRAPDKGEIEMRLSGGFSLLDPAEVLPGPSELARRAKDVSSILARHSETPEKVSAAMETVTADPASFHQLAGKFLFNDFPSREGTGPFGDVNPEVLAFIIFNATKAAFLGAAEVFSGIGTDPWDHGRCPVCGGGPSVAFLSGEGGKRFLVCHRCETRWRFRRMACPFCEKENPAGSGYVYVEDPAYKGITGQVCDGCKGYIKTWRVESEDLGGLRPEVEDLKTPGFDAALEGEGYRRGAANVFGLRVGGGAVS